MFTSAHPLRALAILITAAISTAATPATAPSLPTPADSFDVGTLHVDKFGTGPPSLILIPGLACGPWVWANTITQFAPHYTLYILTLPGFDGRPAATEKRSSRPSLGTSGCCSTPATSKLRSSSSQHW
jgi:pimeloyl-ACP methyl ester carboxylesterase